MKIREKLRLMFCDKELKQDIEFIKEYKKSLYEKLKSSGQKITSEVIRQHQLEISDYGYLIGNTFHGIKIIGKFWERNQYGYYYWRYKVVLPYGTILTLGNDETDCLIKMESKKDAMIYLNQIGKT